MDNLEGGGGGGFEEEAINNSHVLFECIIF